MTKGRPTGDGSWDGLGTFVEGERRRGREFFVPAAEAILYPNNTAPSRCRLLLTETNPTAIHEAFHAISLDARLASALA
jgi:hypothetical protein